MAWFYWNAWGGMNTSERFQKIPPSPIDSEALKHTGF
jgi:hypothetical protein